MHTLREELLAAHSQKKQQLSELGLLREEERQRAAQEQEVALGRVRAEMERVRQDLERSHTAERELAQEKVGDPLSKGGMMHYVGFLLLSKTIIVVDLATLNCL